MQYSPYGFHYIIHLPKYVKRFFKKNWQRARRGWSHQDTWSFDTYLARVIGEGLIHLSENAMGHPVAWDSYEQWTKELKHHGNILLEYEDIELMYNNEEDIKTAYGKVRQSMRWVANNFEDLWD